MSPRRLLLPLALLLLVAATGCTAVAAPEAELSIGAPAGGGASLIRPAEKVDHVALGRAFKQAGIELAPGTNLYAARVERGFGGLEYREFDAGGGAFSTEFWPASSIKVVAAVGALEFLAGMGFTGAATVTSPDGSATVRDLYAEAVRDSDNLAYDWLVSIPGVDWLNTQFLVPRNGFTSTVIQRSYIDPVRGVVPSPAMTISEGDRVVELPERQVTGTDVCPDNGNCSNLLEMTGTVRRIVLADEIPPWERFVIDDEDVAGLRSALLQAEGWLEPGVEAVLGPDAAVFNKPGEAPEDDCIDVGMVQKSRTGYLIAITTPVDGRECQTIAELTAVTLSFLQRAQP